ncbi:phosphatase PAP2 family protein [Chitinophaga polysaccharea]|uniref:phosphatase PAP2 family protein n=1 Tax=Chitinophaga polysaccharea TaxID=1293035 RepID=UPI0021AE7095|nr:phosphatase PAP2 family protein [Chitinophaga polysaccharea]
MKKMIFSTGLAFCTLTCSYSADAQEMDSLPAVSDTVHFIYPAPSGKVPGRFHTTVTGLVVPAAMIGYGVLALNNPTLRDLNSTTKAEIKEDHPGFHTHIDNYLQYTPVAAVYILNAAGIHGKHNLRDRTILLGISAVLTAGTVEIVKNKTHEERPDHSDYLSFPSGHTASAFAAAEYLRQEYKDVSPWYGVAGYLAATTTGALRMYNNRHWLSDVVAGAGVGILSTKAAYWVYPLLQRKLLNASAGAADKVIVPYYNPQFHSAGISFIFFPR